MLCICIGKVRGLFIGPDDSTLEHLEQLTGEKLMNDAFVHIVSIDRPSRKLTIERLYPGGRRELLTVTTLPNVPTDSASKTVDKFALQLGENLLMDSPAARELLNL